MPHNTKIATCCYCGTRAVLTFAVASHDGRSGGKRASAEAAVLGARHELTCSGCGAALTRLKPLKLAQAPPPASRPGPAPRRKAEVDKPKSSKKTRKKSESRRPKRSKPLARRLWGLVDDVIDEIEDIFD